MAYFQLYWFAADWNKQQNITEPVEDCFMNMLYHIMGSQDVSHFVYKNGVHNASWMYVCF